MEPDRFPAATVVAGIDGASVLVADGRGTRLVIDGWQQEQARLLAASGRPDEPLLDPYRHACPPPLPGAGG